MFMPTVDIIPLNVEKLTPQESDSKRRLLQIGEHFVARLRKEMLEVLQVVPPKVVEVMQQKGISEQSRERYWERLGNAFFLLLKNRFVMGFPHVRIPKHFESASLSLLLG